MADAQCRPGHHLGEDLEGRCSVCGNRLERPSLLLTILVLVLVVLLTVMAVGMVLSWWLGL